MYKRDNVGKRFRALQTFSREDNIFNKNDQYTLSEIDVSESLNIYYLTDSNGKNYLFPEFSLGGEFSEYFITIDDERRININKLLYED